MAEPSSKARRLAALAAWPGWGRKSCCRPGRNAWSVPSRASTLSAAVTSATWHRCGQVLARQHQHGEHAVGPVDEGQALLGLQGDGLDAGRGAARGPVAVGFPPALGDLPLADQGQRAVGQRRQVTAAAQRAVLADHRGYPGVEHRGQRLGDRRADAGAAGGQRAQPQEHERPA